MTSMLFRTSLAAGRASWRPVVGAASGSFSALSVAAEASSAAVASLPRPPRRRRPPTAAPARCFAEVPAAPPTVPPTVPPTASATDPATDPRTAPPQIRLYQYGICPFCHIGRALLAYARTGYVAVEVNPLTKAELRPWSGDYTKVPIAVIDGAQVNGSEAIVDALLEAPRVRGALEARWAEDGDGDGDSDGHAAMTVARFQSSDAAGRWARFARDDLAALLYPNICGSVGDAYAAFGYVDRVDAFTPWQRASIRCLGALAMYLAASRVKSKRNITDARASLHAALDKFEAEGLGDGTVPYVSGCSSPDMGDIAVFGVLSSVRGLDAHAEAIRSRGGHVEAWYDRMHRQVSGEGVMR